MELETGMRFKLCDHLDYLEQFEEVEILEIDKPNNRLLVELRSWGKSGRLHLCRKWWGGGLFQLLLELGKLEAIKEPRRRPLVILESPYAGDVERNLEYARRAVRDSLDRGESPIASHLLYTQDGILDDTIPEERALGIDAGLAWKRVADKHVFYIDLGYSAGMAYARNFAKENHLPIEERYILKSVTE